MYGQVDKRKAIAKYQFTPVDTKWIDTNKAFEEEAMQISSRIVARESEGEETLPLEALKAIISIAAKSQANVFNHAHRRATCVFFTQRLGDLC